MLATASKRVFAASRRQLSSVSASCLPASVVDARVFQVVAYFKSVPADVTPQSLFVGDLGLDRLQVRDLARRLGEEFCVDVPHAEADKFISAETAAGFFKAHPKAR
mmetsp:Transcript_17233/g.28832  ORF Transcript_17233/g.28832 Transcript_17233/m.28832 type:complete len:106 (+) Transcript_17233:74-391(+)